MPSIPLDKVGPVNLREYSNEEGTLVPIEFDVDRGDLPFEPKRMFFIRDVPNNGKRGNHAHKTCKQLFIVLNGTFDATIETKYGLYEYIAHDPKRALYVPEKSWVVLDEFEPGTVCLVLASEPYDIKDYINDRKDLKAQW
jgi:hypothetical protein